MKVLNLFCKYQKGKPPTNVNSLNLIKRFGIEGDVHAQWGALLVYYSNAHCYQFRVIRADGAVMGEGKIYYTADAALREGLKWAGR